MPHPIRTEEEMARGPFEVSDFPDKIADTTVAFAMCKAVPEIVDEVGDSPHLAVTYGSLHVENGQTINPDNLMDEPDVVITPKEGTYTLMMVDPDAPKPNAPKYRSWLHWLVINIPANDVARGEEVLGYQPPEPAEGRHRYLYLLFKQHGRVTTRQPAKRQGFQVREWAKEHELGNPVNGLFFWSSADA